MASGLRSPAFTQAVVRAMRELYPEELADRRWDNVGLLLGNIDSASPSPLAAPLAAETTKTGTVLLTIDLTLAVVEEALRKHASVIVTYHPFIFRGLKSLTLDDPQQTMAILLARHNIAVYSPHTALDAAPGGLNDALAYGIELLAQDHAIRYNSRVLQPVPAALPRGYDASKCGYGRIVELEQSVELDTVIMAYERLLNPSGHGRARYVMLARPNIPGKQPTPFMVRSVAVCAGSGYDVLKDCGADLLVTGEMTHHNALRATMQGQCVLTFFHSNSERFFLQSRLRSQLQVKLEEQGCEASVLVSEEDKDPFAVVEIGGAV